MDSQIFYSETPEVFFNKLRSLLSKLLKEELALNQRQESTPDDFIKITEVCRILKVTKPTVHKQAALGYYKKHYAGRNVLFERNEILEFIRSDKISCKNKER
ncbi:MAG: helix-turn-helix domain-containing protein [Ginsengibacter sp.]|jgi:hypothetical protein